MTDTVIISFITVMLAPTVLMVLQLFAQRAKTKAEWKRHDDLMESQREIHALVNSNLTKEIRARREGLARELAGLRELVSIKVKQKDKPYPETMAAIKALKAEIVELDTQLKDRFSSGMLADQMRHFNAGHKPERE